MGIMSCRLMKRNFAILLFFAFAVVLMPRNASCAASVDEQVKKLAERCKQIEAQLDRSVHYSRKQNPMARRLLSKRCSMALKVAVERTDSSGRVLTEYTGDFFRRDMLCSRAKELRLPD